MNPPVKPCGTCGREPKVGIVLGAGWIVTCESCGRHSWPFESAEQAIAAWNERSEG